DRAWARRRSTGRGRGAWSRASRGSPSVGAGAVRDGADGADEELQVKRQRPVVDVAQVEPQRVLPREVAPPADLPKTGESGAEAQTGGRGVGVAGDLRGEGRAGGG